MAKIPFRPKPEGLPNISYNRVLRDVVPTLDKQVVANDFERSMSRVQRNQQSTDLRSSDSRHPEHKRPDRQHFDPAHHGLQPPDRSHPDKHHWTGIPQSQALGGIESQGDAAMTRHPVLTDNPALSDWRQHPSKTSSNLNETGSTIAAMSESDEQVADDSVTTETFGTLEHSPDANQSERKKLKIADSGGDGTTVSQPTTNISTNSFSHMGDVSAADIRRAPDFGSFETVQAMWRQLDLLDSNGTPSAWRFSLQQGEGSAIELAVHADSNGVWSIEVSASAEHGVPACADELRDCLISRHQRIGTVTVNTESPE